MSVNKKYNQNVPRISGKYYEPFNLMIIAFFSKAHNAERFEEALSILRKYFFLSLKKLDYSCYVKLRKTPEFLKVLDADNDADTLNFLLKRIVAIYLIFVKEHDADDVRDALMARTCDVKDEYKLTYLDHKLKLHFPKGYDLTEYVHLVRTYLINPIHGLTTDELRAVKLLTDTLSELEIKIIQEFGPAFI